MRSPLTKRLRHDRRLQRLAAAAAALARDTDVKGTTLCQAAGIEGPHREASLAAAIGKGVIKPVYPGGIRPRKPSAGWYRYNEQ